MTETQTEDMVVEPITVRVGNWPAVKGDEIEGIGYTLVVGATDRAQLLLAQDENRIRAVIMTTAAIKVGSKNQMLGLGVITATDGSPGALLLANFPIPIRGNNEVWLATTGAANIGVWVERKIDRG